MIYLQTILKRDEEEITKRIFREQLKNPCPGDFIELIKDDFKLINKTYSENFILASGPTYSTFVKKQIREAAFKHLVTFQKGHSKVMDIEYEKFATQNYLVSPTFSNTDVSLLAALRSHTLRGIRCNFKNMF